jgi:hypothetical protein
MVNAANGMTYRGFAFCHLIFSMVNAANGMAYRGFAFCHFIF